MITADNDVMGFLVLDSSEDVQARRLYLKAGFEETVKTVIGRRGPQYVFRWHIVK